VASGRKGWPHSMPAKPLSVLHRFIYARWQRAQARGARRRGHGEAERITGVTWWNKSCAVRSGRSLKPPPSQEKEEEEEAVLLKRTAHFWVYQAHRSSEVKSRARRASKHASDRTPWLL